VQHLQHLSWERRMQMLHDVACGMMYIHERRYVHSDLRSANLFVKEGGRVSVVGIAAPAENHWMFLQAVLCHNPTAAAVWLRKFC
jgi:serine/threonine protein kinase